MRLSKQKREKRDQQKAGKERFALTGLGCAVCGRNQLAIAPFLAIILLPRLYIRYSISLSLSIATTTTILFSIENGMMT
jgi:hypothetical protein